VLAVIWGLKQLAQDGPDWPPTLSILAGLAVGVLFVRRQRALADPLLDLSLFRSSAFSAALAANTLDFFVSFAALLFIAQYLQLVLGLSPLQAGLWMLPSSLGFIVGSLLTPLLVRRARPAFVMAAGMVLAAVGFGLLTQVDGIAGLAVLVTGSVVFSLGSAPTTTLATDLMIGTAPPERAGAASGISETSSEFGGALGIAILGVIGTAVYRGQVADTVPAAIPPEAAAAARDTLGGAVAAVGQLPDPLGAALLAAARQAFTQGLQLTFAISAAIAVGIAVLAAALLRHVGADAEPEGPPDPSPGGPCAGKVGVVKVSKAALPGREQGQDDAGVTELATGHGRDTPPHPNGPDAR
jgi:MFS transporter, DHA2 family, multidrug resistance protein